MIDRSEMERLTDPRNLDDILARYRKEDTAMSDDKIELRAAVAREREAEALLGPTEVGIIRAIWGREKSLYEAAIDNYGSLMQLSALRQDQRIQLSRSRRSIDERRQTALELADQFGVPRALVEAELEREEREGL